MRILTLLIPLTLTLSACVAVVPTPIPGPVVAPAADLTQCGGNGLYVLVGHPATSLPDSGTWSYLRVIKPGTVVTMDYVANRLNARVDPMGRIVSLTCG